MNIYQAGSRIYFSWNGNSYTCECLLPHEPSLFEISIAIERMGDRDLLWRRDDQSSPYEPTVENAKLYFARHGIIFEKVEPLILN